MPRISNFKKHKSQTQNQAARLAVEAPSACLHPESPEVLEKLELLDDLVYDAMSGRPGALSQLQSTMAHLANGIGLRAAGGIARTVPALCLDDLGRLRGQREYPQSNPSRSGPGRALPAVR